MLSLLSPPHLLLTWTYLVQVMILKVCIICCWVGFSISIKFSYLCRLGLVEQEFTKMKAIIQQLLQKVTQLERALQQPSGSASQQQASVGATQPVYSSSSLPIIPQAASATRLPSSVINKRKLQPVARTTRPSWQRW